MTSRCRVLRTTVDRATPKLALMRSLALSLTLCTGHTGLFSQDHAEESGYFSSPLPTPSGFVCTNNLASAIYLVGHRQVAELISSPGCGNYMSVSPGRDVIGFKLIYDDGSQAPAILNLKTRTIAPLHRGVYQAGQVSFTTDGRYAFTIGDSLVMTDGVKKSTYSLGTYANLAPVPPNGNFVAYNDPDDQIWLLDLLTGKRFMITHGKQGYVNPVWSPDGQRLLFSSHDATIHVYQLTSRELFDLGNGFHPAWSVDSRRIVYEDHETRDLTLTSSDLYTVRSDGTDRTRLTDSPDLFEMDPQFTDGDSTVVFHTYTRREIVAARVSRNGGVLSHQWTIPVAPAHLRAASAPADGRSKVLTLDIPYVHQVYDTPDWFNGHWACAPTTAIMVIAYYNLLPRWDTWCSWPSPGHHSNWGNYVSEKYYFRQFSFSLFADDPNGRPAQGGYGYMWNGSATPYARMADYYRQHGLTAARLDAPGHSAAVSEIAGGYPFSLCVGLTTAGHLVLAHGLGAEQHTVVVNDPYGNKNAPGYPNYGGKDAQYDWPGYNNGFQNLTQVYWGVTTRPPVIAVSDTVVDDLQFNRGFYLHTQAPSSMGYWRDLTRGYQGHVWWTSTRHSTDTCYATWCPTLRRAGQYEVSAYVPLSNATAAYYKVHAFDGVHTVVINQHDYAEAWVSLGTFNFRQGTEGFVRLGDASDIAGQEIVFDAVRWVLRDTAFTGVDDMFAGRAPGAFVLEQNYPNPFNPKTSFEFKVPSSDGSTSLTTRLVTLKVFDLLGREVATLVNEVKQPGTYTLQFDGSGLSSGMYFYRLQAGSFVGTKKFIMMK